MRPSAPNPLSGRVPSRWGPTPWSGGSASHVPDCSWRAARSCFRRPIRWSVPAYATSPISRPIRGAGSSARSARSSCSSSAAAPPARRRAACAGCMPASGGRVSTAAPYRALDPDAYAWVHLANFDSTLAFHRWFGPALRPEEQATALRRVAAGGPTARDRRRTPAGRPRRLPASCPRRGRRDPDGQRDRADAARQLPALGRRATVAPDARARLAGAPPAGRLVRARRHRRHACPGRCAADWACAGRRRTGRGSRPRRSWCGRRRCRCPTGSRTTRWAPAPGARPGKPAADGPRHDPPDGGTRA